LGGGLAQALGCRNKSPGRLSIAKSKGLSIVPPMKTNIWRGSNCLSKAGHITTTLFYLKGNLADAYKKQ